MTALKISADDVIDESLFVIFRTQRYEPRLPANLQACDQAVPAINHIPIGRTHNWIPQTVCGDIRD
jgi:hypothetical protein